MRPVLERLETRCAPAVVQPLLITSRFLSDWTVNQPGYNQIMNVQGGVPPYVVRTLAGAPPPGITMDRSGHIAGTPTVVGSFTFGVQAQDSTRASAFWHYTITINPPVTLLQVPLPDAAVGTFYLQFLYAQGGTVGAGGSYTFNVHGALPAGMILTDSGILAGVPTSAGVYSFTVIATDATGASGLESFSLIVPQLTP